MTSNCFHTGSNCIRLIRVVWCLAYYVWRNWNSNEKAKEALKPRNRWHYWLKSERRRLQNSCNLQSNMEESDQRNGQNRSLSHYQRWYYLGNFQVIWSWNETGWNSAEYQQKSEVSSASWWRTGRPVQNHGRCATRRSDIANNFHLLSWKSNGHNKGE